MSFMRGTIRPLGRLQLVLGLAFAQSALAQDWQPYTDEGNLRSLVTDTVLEGTLRDGVKAIGRYRADGTGTLEAWGDTFERRWVVRDKRISIIVGTQEQCVRIEKAADRKNLYRASNEATGETAEFSVSEDGAAAVAAQNSGAGGAAEPSAEELAKSLANTNTPLASQTFKFQYRTFDGDLRGADDESSSLLLYQPAFPFPLDNGATVFFRPAVPIILDQPYFDPLEGEFDSTSGLGDVAFDLAYGRTTESGLLWAAGVVSTLPTATEDELGTDRWSLGPEFLIGKLTSKYVLGALVTYQTDVAGSGDADIRLERGQRPHHELRPREQPVDPAAQPDRGQDRDLERSTLEAGRRGELLRRPGGRLWAEVDVRHQCGAGGRECLRKDAQVIVPCFPRAISYPRSLHWQFS